MGVCSVPVCVSRSTLSMVSEEIQERLDFIEQYAKCSLPKSRRIMGVNLAQAEIIGMLKVCNVIGISELELEIKKHNKYGLQEQIKCVMNE